MHMKPSLRFLLPFLTLLLISARAEPIKPKVIILTTFEAGADTGDEPGELQYWVEREHLTKSIEIPGVAHPLLYNDDGVYAMVTGTCNRSGLAVMALGLDPRFDLKQTYWLTAGIAGVDADKASVGSATCRRRRQRARDRRTRRAGRLALRHLCLRQHWSA